MISDRSESQGMKLLHVTLGNPQRHEGGLNRYCLDLVEAQTLLGINVGIIFPGTYTDKSRVNIKKVGSGLYKIDNSLPVPITYGINEPERYMKETDIQSYREWLENFRPDVIHVHSFMGIHKEFFEAAKELGIRSVFTTHDYFPICFKVNLFNQKHEICENFDISGCISCNLDCGLSKTTQRVKQSDIYPVLKKIKKALPQFKSKGAINKTANDQSLPQITQKSIRSYEQLRSYYYDIMNLFDVIHCNSKVAMQYYKNVYPCLDYRFEAITHNGIKKTRHVRKDKKLRISYFGGMSEHKGYSQLMAVIRLLPDDGSWELNLYGGEFSGEYPNNVHPIGYFNQSDENMVWDSTDLYLFISQWPETFGFGVLEALAHNIPVICTDISGSSCLLEQVREHCIYNHNDVEDLHEKIIYMFEMSNYKELQNSLNNLDVEVSMKAHAENIASHIYRR